MDDLDFRPSATADDIGFRPVIDRAAQAARPKTVLEATSPLTAKAVGETGSNADAISSPPGTTAEDIRDANLFPNRGDAASALQKTAVIGASLAVPPLGEGIAGTALTGAASGLAGSFVNQATGGGEGSLGKRALDVGIDAATGGLLGGGAGAVAKAAGPLANFAYSLPVIGPALAKVTPKWLAARILAPSEERIANAAANRGRDVIEAATGERPPIGVGEAIGSPDVVQSLKVIPEGAEPTQEAMELLKRNVLFSASRLGGIGLTADEIAKDALGTLRAHVGDISGKVVKATEDLASTYATKLADAHAEIQAGAGAIFPNSGASAKTLGEKLRDEAQTAFQATKSAWDTLYEKARNAPGYRDPVIDVAPLGQWVGSVEGAALQTPKGAAIASALPEGTKTFIDTIRQAAGKPQSIEALKNLRTEVADGISDADYLPGIGAGRKKQLVGVLTGIIDKGLDTLPSGELKAAMKAANANYSQNVDRFQGALASGILRDTGKAAGKNPETVAGLFSGPQGASNLETVRNLLGSSADQGDAIIREHLLNEIGQSAKDPFGKFSVAKLEKGLADLPPEVRSVVLRNTSALSTLAEREARLKGLPDPQKFAEGLTLDAPTLQKALGPGATKDVDAAMQEAVAAKAIEAKAFRNQVLNDISKSSSDALEKNPAAFVDGILSGSFSPIHVRGAMDILARESPQAAEQVQFRYLEKLLSDASNKNGLDAALLARSLEKTSATGTGGASTGTAEAILGTGRTEQLRKLASSFGSIDAAAGSKIGQDSSVLEGILRGAGLVAGASEMIPKVGPVGASNVLGFIARKSRETRYAVAASLLTDQSLRQIASKPLSQVTKDELRQIVSVAIKALAGAGASDSTISDLAESAAGLHDSSP